MHLFDKDVKPRPTWRFIVIAICALAVGAMSVSGLVYAMSKQVSIVDDNGYYEEFTTYKSTTAEVLAEKGVTLQSDDEVNYGLNEVFPDGAQIIVSRAVYFNIINGDEENLKTTAKKKLSAVIDSKGNETRDNTILNVGLDDKIFEGLTIRIVYSKEEIITVEEIIPFNVTKKSTTKLKEGETKVVQEGSEGLLKKTYNVFYENNHEVNRELIEKEIVTSPTDRIIEYGEAAKPKVAVVYNSGSIVSRGGELRYKGVITCSASAYSIKGTTASGIPSQVGAVAVDPSVIPLGTRLYIECADGTWTYGNAVAADTGGAIKGNKVDLYMETYQEAIKFGRRNAKVYILE